MANNVHGEGLRNMGVPNPDNSHWLPSSIDGNLGHLLVRRNLTKACSGRAISMSLMRGFNLAAVRARR